jgi:hypothetical protein
MKCKCGSGLEVQVAEGWGWCCGINHGVPLTVIKDKLELTSLNKCPDCRYLPLTYFKDPCNSCVKDGFINFEAKDGTGRDDRRDAKG